jgi:predicted MFS family arabinose efflux permease
LSQKLAQPPETIDREKITNTDQGIDNRLVFIMSIACAISVANLYYSQPILANMGNTFHVSFGQSGLIATVGQLGYALGLLLIVPLGDLYNRRTLIVCLLGLVTLALIATAAAPSFILLTLASLAVGVTTVVPQVIIPFAASLAPVNRRGRVVGTIMSGLLIGILGARTISGVISAYLGWRAVYWIAAALMIILAIVLRFLLPQDRPHQSMNYGQLMRSLGNLIRTQPALREASLFGALAFGAFSAFWVTLGFYLQTPPYHFGSDVTGLFGLVGIAGALAASFVGKLADKRDIRQTTGLALGVLLLSLLVIWFTGEWIWSLIIGVILLDLGTQSTQISNQARVYTLKVDAPSRLNTVYMVTYFIGGSLGSLIASYGWAQAQWNGVCGCACVMVLCALGIFFVNGRRNKKRAETVQVEGSVVE